jgi:pilus assembly protein CpaB
MDRNKIILLVIALLIAVVTVVVARSMISTEASAPEEVKVQLQILVAAKDLPSGTLTKESDLRWQNWPADSKTDNMIVNISDDKNTYIGTVVRAGIREGEPITKNNVLRPGEQGFLAAVLQPGKRAISVKITPVTGVAGLVFPGDRVDVILTHIVESPDDPQLKSRRISETMVHDARVLALDQTTDDQTKEPKLAEVATIEVSSKEAEKIALMADWGTVALVLRSVAGADLDNPAATTAKDNTNGVAISADALKTGDHNYTWDSDVSAALPGPPFDSNTVRKIQVQRGKETSEVLFDQRRR